MTAPCAWRCRAGSRIEAISSVIAAGSLNTFEAGNDMNSAKQPGRLTPTPMVLRHRWRRPARQLRQKPQVTWPSPDTRSPIFRPRTSLPISTISPQYSWPDGHRHLDRALRPLVPVVDVHVGAADGGLLHADQHIVRADRGLGDVRHPDARFCLGLDQCFHDLDLSVDFALLQHAKFATGGLNAAIARSSARGCARPSAACGCAPGPSARPETKIR